MIYFIYILYIHVPWHGNTEITMAWGGGPCAPLLAYVVCISMLALSGSARGPCRPSGVGDLLEMWWLCVGDVVIMNGHALPIRWQCFSGVFIMV